MNYSLQNKEAFIAKAQVIELLDRHMADNNWKSVLLLPPDITRSHSGAGFSTAHYYQQLTARGCSVRTHSRIKLLPPWESDSTKIFIVHNLFPLAYHVL